MGSLTEKINMDEQNKEVQTEVSKRVRKFEYSKNDVNFSFQFDIVEPVKSISEVKTFLELLDQGRADLNELLAKMESDIARGKTPSVNG